MTAVIGGSAGGDYRHGMAARDDVQHVAAALARPRAGYLKRLETARVAMTARSGDAASQLAVFVDRIGDLTTEELRELYNETFGRGALQGTEAMALRLLRRSASCQQARAALDALAPMLNRLEADRNPFAYVVRALCCLLLVRADHGQMERSSQ